MSLITSCPACGTMFRVVPDQLKISEGWVRCGHCAEVFDAAAHLADRLPPGLPADDPITEPAGLDLPPAHADAASRSDEPPAANAADPAFWDFTPPSARRGLEGAAAFDADPSPTTTPAQLPESIATPSDSAADPPRVRRPFTRPPWPAPATADAGVPGADAKAGHQTSGPAVVALAPSPPVPAATPYMAPATPEARSVSAPVASRPVPLQGEDVEPDPEINQVSFVRQARRRAFWRSPLMRSLLTLVLLTLAAGLAGQVAYQDRDRLALLQPALKPALEQMCELLGCRLAPPRQIEAIVIDSSGFNRLRSDTYRLSFSLRNTAGVDLAVPAIELTLTDLQDQPVLRRVLTPEELGASKALIPAASEWAGTVGLTVQANGARIAGYRLLAFYP